jgi:NADH-quinone oxidoreductase subunit F
METPLTERIEPGEPPPGLSEYEETGGYAAVRKAIGEMTPSEVAGEVEDANLKGRGGAGFPAGQKWSFVPMGEEASHPKYLVCNADEMEPGTFKDRHLMEGDPHGLVESMVVAAYALQADVGYIFLRWAYKTSERRLREAIAEAEEAGYLGEDILGSGWDFELHLHVSAGRYMCGEETALLNVLEGGRATPRSKPPYPQTNGLWGQPTVVQNVETLYCVPHIIERGADWFLDLSEAEGGGTKLYGMSGQVENRGLWELPLGTTLGELLEEYAGGMSGDLEFRGALPGGASTDFLTDEHLEVPLDFNSVQEAGSRLGTGTAIVLDDQTCPIGMVENLEKFFARESCGWCTPCREGLPWIQELLQDFCSGEARPEDLEKLERHTDFLGPGRTFCALAPGAMEPLQSALEYYREDFEEHIERGCTYEHDAGTAIGGR